MKKMPVIFVGHGSPMNALADNIFTQTLHQWGRDIPMPKAILMISAHWLSHQQTLIQHSLAPEQIYDFYGFPQALYDLKYTVSGQPELAQLAQSKILSNPAILTEEWGVDHGSWSILKHLYPDANIPVFQLSIDFSQPASFHYQLGKELSSLREQGVLIVGSGNVIHNLSTVDWKSPLNIPSQLWVTQLDNSIKSALDHNDISSLSNYQQFKGAEIGIKNPDHYLPLLYVLGAAHQSTSITHTYEGFELGTLSMRCISYE